MGWGGEPIEGFFSFEKEKDMGACSGRDVGAQPRTSPCFRGGWVKVPRPLGAGPGAGALPGFLRLSGPGFWARQSY